MLVTIDVVKFTRRRDAIRLLRRPRRHYAVTPAWTRSLLRIRRWRTSDLKEVVVVAAWEDSPAELQAPAVETWRGVFELQRGHGTIQGGDPLGPPSAPAADGPGVIWTAGNVRLRRVPAFLGQNDRVLPELHSAPGRLEDFGVAGLWKHGPWMCTLSFWQSLDAGLAFAYRGAAQHREAVKRMRAGDFGTRETYFARLALVASSGALDGRDPFAAAAEAVAA